MTKALRGINLGGWLITERWMTPQLFRGVQASGEIALVKELGKVEAERRLNFHRDSFIRENDIAWVARSGFDFLRIPVGYWLLEPNQRFIEGESYLERVFTWAEKYDLSIILDFHGLQGSQNGYEHSGEPGKVRLFRPWHKKASLHTLEYLCRTYGQRKSLIGLEVINEPQIRFGWYDWWRLMRYYDGAVELCKRFLRPETKIIVSDAFHPIEMARRLSKRGYGSRVVLDMHLYQMFGRKQQHLTVQEHIEQVEKVWQPLLSDVSSFMPVLVGEWSAALPAAAYANEATTKELECVRYFKAQENLFETVVWAHSYWSYRAPSSGVWDYKKINSLVKKHG